MSKIITFLRQPIISIKRKRQECRQNYIENSLKPENFVRLSDKKAIKVRYYLNFGKYPDLKHPKTFNEKLQWLKLYDRRPEYTKLVDKYEVKKYVANRIGEEYIIPTLGVWNNAEEIDFDSLPNQFVLKCTHDSESIVICKNKAEFDISVAKKKLTDCLKKSLFLWGREWPYKNVKPRIIAEEYLKNDNGTLLNDYKFFCFNGEVKTLLIVSERFEGGSKLDYFDLSGNHMPIKHTYPNAATPPALPKHFEQMKKLAEILSVGYPHIRLDFYECNGKIYFGEMTFFTGSGFLPFTPESWDETFGSWIQLPHKKTKSP